MIEITKAGTTLIFDENKLTFEMRRDQEAWRWAGNYVPKMIFHMKKPRMEREAESSVFMRDFV